MQAYRASIFDLVADPAQHEKSWRFFEDGLLLVEKGKIIACGDYQDLKSRRQDFDPIIDYSGYLIIPGFIDTHLHYPQTDMIASHGSQLLDWLNRYTFPTENSFIDPSVAKETAEFFVQELLRNGTTTAMVFATVHPQSVDAIFNTAAKKNMCLLSGKVMMDRHAPDFLCDTAQSSYDDSKALIERWHGKHRLHYALTPRFAPTSSEDQLRVAQQLLQEYPDVYLQSHVAENQHEVSWVKQLFPWSRSYLDVYQKFDLLGSRSIYAHCIHLDNIDRQSMAQAQASMSFCPTSNLFLGSGLFDLQAAQEHRLSVTIGTDVGAGTSFNLWQTMNEAYKVCQMSGFNLSPLKALFMATLGASRALKLDHEIGNFEIGKIADFNVIDVNATPLLHRRMQSAESIEEKLFALMMLGDDRCNFATYIFGKACHFRDKP